MGDLVVRCRSDTKRAVTTEYPGSRVGPAEKAVVYADPWDLLWVMPAKGVRDVSIRGLDVDPWMFCVTG